MCISIIVAPIIGIVRKKEGSAIFLAGLLVLFLANLNDMLVARALIISVSLGQLGLFVFIFAQSYLLSRMFSKAFIQIEIDGNKIRRMHDELKEKERARTLFFHNASHELRTPLTGIIGFLEIFSSGHYGTINQKMSSQLVKITNLANSLLHQINAILNLAKAKKDEGLQLINSSISLNELTQNIQNLAEGLAQKSNETTFSCTKSWSDDEKPTFINDDEKIFTILRNLVGNSFKFKSKNHDNKINLSLNLNNQELTIVVTDTGCGIPEEDQERIFEEFEQVEKETNRAHEGTGLGLALVKKFVTLMGGKLSLTSELDKGSTFTITIPEQSEISLSDTSKPASMKDKIKEEALAEDQETDDNEDSTDEKSVVSDESAEFLKASQKGLSVLIVDDNETILEVVEDVLTSNNYLTTIAPGGEYALKEVKQSKPDLILLDLMMPQVSGEDVLKYIKGNDEYKDIPVILLTARASHEDKIFGLQLGADDYLSKPIDFNELLLRVKNTLNRTNLVRTMEQLIHREKMAQVGDLMGEFSHEIKNLTIQNQIDPEMRLNKISSILNTFKYPQPDWQNVINALDKDSVPITKQNSRQETFDGFSVNTKSVKDLRFLSIVMKALDVDDDAIYKTWKSISEGAPEEITNLRNIVEITSSLLIFASSSKRTHELAVTILNFSRSKPVNEEFVLHKLISDCASLLKARINRGGVQINNTLDDNQVVFANKSDVHQITLNLLVNAVDALIDSKAPKKEININFKENGENLTVVFEDNGGGIPEEIIENIFTKDFSTKGEKGSGIGLFVSRNLAQKNKGSLQVRSEKGSTFFELRLPKKPMQTVKEKESTQQAEL
jgi:signal transduction histidine kinase